MTNPAWPRVTPEQEELLAALREIAATPVPLPAGGETAQRHSFLMSIGRRDLSLARLAEAHLDAIAILAEAGRSPSAGALYGVWASEIPGEELSLTAQANGLSLTGSKHFCSGAGLLDRALVTVGAPQPQLIDVDMRKHAARIAIDLSAWHTAAFAQTNTGKVTFDAVPLAEENLVCAPGWYLQRPGFWHGACGPAACWAGGAEGLLDYALQQSQQDPHKLAHLGAMHAAIWSLKAVLDLAGREIDRSPLDATTARICARTVRHLVEQAATEVLRRIPRAYGPRPLAFQAEVSRRYQELDLYLRQSHAERDLEALGNDLLPPHPDLG